MEEWRRPLTGTRDSIPYNNFFTNFASQRGVSSVGSERLLDRQEVAGSIPVHPTDYKAHSTLRQLFAPFFVSSTETLGQKQYSHRVSIRY